MVHVFALFLSSSLSSSCSLISMFYDLLLRIELFALSYVHVPVVTLV